MAHNLIQIAKIHEKKGSDYQMLKKIAIYIPSVLVPMIVNFVLVILFARYLEPEEYGLMNIYLNTISLVYAFGLSFLQSAAFRFYSIKNYVKSTEQYITTYIISNIILTLLYFSFMIIINEYFFQFNANIIAFSIGANALYQLYLNLYRLEDSSRGYTYGRILTSVLTLAFFFLFLSLVKGVDYNHAIYSIYGAYAIIAIVELLKRWNSIKPLQFSFELVRKSFSYGIPMTGVFVVGLIVSYSDQYLILHFLGTKFVGFYSLGYRFADTLISNLTMIILIVMTPTLMKIYDNGNNQESERIISGMININLWIVLPISLCLMIYAESIILIVFPSYVGAATIIQLVVVAAVMHSLSMFTCKGLELAKETKRIFLYLLTAGIINFTYNVIFIPVYGINASAHSSFISYFVYNILLVMGSMKFVKITFDLIFILKLAVINTFTCILAIIIKRYWPVSTLYELLGHVIICGSFYIIVSTLSKLLNKEKFIII
jgi:O-antigen/teichoic acid export membrane protein